MPRRYRRRNFSRKKYSVEQCNLITLSSSWNSVAAGTSTQASRQAYFPIVPATEVQGMRKCKHFTLTFSSSVTAIYYYVLVYVPEGYEPNPIGFPENEVVVSCYEPNQYVLSQGWLDFDGGPLRIRSILSRNLNSGDSIYLLLGTTNTTVGTLAISVKYAITLH